ncbi:MAG TPA: hypothetical protein DHV31_00195, partial [Clostridiales bacterium]|nr:hypothetical protein [Clostridiales bacterium]
MKLDGIQIAELKGSELRRAIHTVLENLQLQATVIVRDNNDGDKIVLAAYYKYDESDKLYVNIPALNLKLQLSDLLDLADILASLVPETSAEAAGEVGGGFAVEDILKFVDRVKISNHKLEMDLSSQILSRILLLAGVEITLPEIYSTLTLGKLSTAVNEVNEGLGFKVMSALIPSFNGEIRIGNFDMAMEREGADLLAPYADFFGNLYNYATLDSMQAKVEFEVDFSYGLGENVSNADGNAWSFKALLNTLGIDTVLNILEDSTTHESLKGNYKMTVSATVNVAEGLKGLYGLEIYLAVYSVDGNTYDKQFSIYYGKGVLGLNFEPLLGVRPFELDVDLGEMMGGLYSKEKTATAEEEEKKAGIDFIEVISSLSGVISLYVQEQSAVITLTGAVLQTALVTMGMDNYFPVTAQGITPLATEQMNAIPEGKYTVEVNYVGGEKDSFVYNHVLRRDTFDIDLTDCKVSSIRLTSDAGVDRTYNYERDWKKIFDIDAVAGKITWVDPLTSDLSEDDLAEFMALPFGEYTVTVTRTNGKAARSFKIKKTIASYTYSDGLYLKGRTISNIVIKGAGAKDSMDIRQDIALAPQESVGYGLIKDYFAINVSGGLFDVEVGDVIRAKVQIKDDTYLEVKLSDIVVDMSGGSVERKDKNGEVETYSDENIKSVYVEFSVDLSAYAEQGYKLDLKETIGDMLSGVMGGFFNNTDMNFYAEKAIDLNYRFDVQASLKFDNNVLDLPHSELAIAVVDLGELADGSDDEELFSVYYVGTEAPNGALYLNIPYFDLMLKVNEINFVDLIQKINPFASSEESEEAVAGAEGQEPTVAQTVMSMILGVNVRPGSSAEGNLQAVFAKNALNVLLKLVGLNFTLPDLKEDASSLRMYIDKDNDDLVKVDLKFDITRDSSISLTIKQPKIDLNKKMEYRNNLGFYTSISEAGSIGVDLSASFTVENEETNTVDIGSLVSLLANQNGGDKSLKIVTEKGSSTYTLNASVIFSLQDVYDELLGLLEDKTMSTTDMVKSMLKDLYAHIVLERTTVDADEKVTRLNMLEVYFYNNCLYVDLSALGLPKAALPMNLADLIPTAASAESDESVCGCTNTNCVAHFATAVDPAHPCRDTDGKLYTGCTCRYCDPESDEAFNVYYTLRGILVKMEAEMFTAALAYLGIENTLDLTFNARIHSEDGISASVNLKGLDQNGDPAYTKATLSFLKPTVTLGGVIEDVLDDTSDYGYLNDLEAVSIAFKVELETLLKNTSDAGRPYQLDGILADLFGGESIPLTLLKDLESDILLEVEANLDLKDPVCSEILIRITNKGEDWITMFYGGEYDLVVYLPIVDETFNMTFNVNLIKLLGDDTVMEIQSLPSRISAAIYGTLGVSQAAAAESESSESILDLALSVLENVSFSTTGKITLNCFGTVLSKFSEALLGSEIYLGDLQYVKVFADLLHKEIGLSAKSETAQEVFNTLDFTVKDYAVGLVKREINFDKSLYNTLDDYEFMYVKASGSVEYDLPDGEYDIGGLLKSIADNVNIPVVFEGLQGSLDVNVEMKICVDELKRSEFLVEIMWNKNYVIQAYMDVLQQEIYVYMPWFDVQKFLIKGVDTSFIADLLPSAYGDETSAAESAVASSSAARYATLLGKLVNGILITDGSNPEYGEAGVNIRLDNSFFEILLSEFVSSLEIELPIRFTSSNVSINKNKINFSFDFDKDLQAGYIKGALKLDNMGFRDENIRPEITQNVTEFTPLLDYKAVNPLILEYLYVNTELLLDASFIEQQLNMDDIFMYIFGEGFDLVSEEVEAAFRLQIEGNLNIKRIERSELVVNLYMKSKGVERLFVRAYLVGLDEALYVDAPLLGLYGIKMRGINIASLFGNGEQEHTEEPGITELSCGCKCETCLEKGSCYGMVNGVLTRLCDEHCTCSHCMVPGCTCTEPMCVAMGSCYDEHGLKRCDSNCGCARLSCGCNNMECYLNGGCVGEVKHCEEDCTCTCCMVAGCGCVCEDCVANGSCYDEHGNKICAGDCDCGCSALPCGCTDDECEARGGCYVNGVRTCDGEHCHCTCSYLEDGCTCDACIKNGGCTTSDGRKLCKTGCTCEHCVLPCGCDDPGCVAMGGCGVNGMYCNDYGDSCCSCHS